MPTKAEIINQIETEIIPNLMELITGGILQNNLLGMVHQINDLVGELEDLDTEDVTSIVNAINSLKLRIDGIEDDLTPWVFYGGDDPNVTMPTGFGGEIPAFYVQQEHVGLDVVNVGLWTYTGIVGNEWINLVSAGGGSSLTLEQARQNGNVLEGETISNSSILANLLGVKSYGDFNVIELVDDGGVGMILLKDADIGFVHLELNASSRSISWVFNNYNVITKLSAFDESSLLLENNNSSNFKGIIGNEEFDKQGDRTAFAQISDLQDQIKTRTKTIRMVLSPDGEDITTGDKKSFYIDKDCEFVSLEITSETAPVGGVGIQVGLKLNGVDITDTPATIESGENTSFDSTPAEMTTTTFERGDKITPNVSAVGTTTKGKDLQLIFTYRETI